MANTWRTLASTSPTDDLCICGICYFEFSMQQKLSLLCTRLDEPIIDEHSLNQMLIIHTQRNVYPKIAVCHSTYLYTKYYKLRMFTIWKLKHKQKKRPWCVYGHWNKTPLSVWVECTHLLSIKSQRCSLFFFLKWNIDRLFQYKRESLKTELKIKINKNFEEGLVKNQMYIVYDAVVSM